VSGFGISSMSGNQGASTPVTAPTSASNAPASEVTASQFASMLVALLGGESSEEVMQPIARLEEDSNTETGDETTTADAANSLHYGLLVDDLRPMSPLATLPPTDQLVASNAPAIAPTVDPPIRAGERTITVPTRDMDALTPEFRSRLDRVIDRMRNEFGHDVQLVETGRSPERQAWLFAQGRTRPGPVVTWTQHSAHLTGDAADVIIDGQWRDDRAYGRLHRIANEEGLRTLGARDPGHLELPAALREARVQLAAESATRATVQGATAQQAGLDIAHQAIARAAARAHRHTHGQKHGVVTGVPSALETASASGAVADMSSDVQGIAGVAAPATVASVASVASTARVARPGSSSADAQGERVQSDLTLARSERHRRRHDRDDREGAVPFLGTATAAASTASADHDSVSGRLVGSIDRIDRTNAIAGRSPREVAQLTLALDGGNGQQDDITIGVRGASVGATVSTTDSAMADRLRDNVVDLRKALESRGLGMDEFRADARRTELNDPARMLASTDRDAVRVRSMSDTNASFLGREGQDDTRGQGEDRRAPREQRQQNDAQQSQQDQRERQSAARDNAARLAAFRRVGRPIQGDNVA
jgi:hypothetical protein